MLYQRVAPSPVLLVSCSGLEAVVTGVGSRVLRDRMCLRVGEVCGQVDADASVREIVALAYTTGVADMSDALAVACDPGDLEETDSFGGWVSGYREGLRAAGRAARSCRDMAVMLRHPSSGGWSR